MEINAQYVINLRKKLGLTQQELADRLHCSRESVINWENGGTITRTRKMQLREFAEESKVEEPQVTYFTAKRKHHDSIENAFHHEDDKFYNSFGNTFIPLENGDGYLMETPIVPTYARAGAMAGFVDQGYFDDLPRHKIRVDRIHSGKYITIRCQGDSMDADTRDAILDGAMVTGREIQKMHWTSKLHIKSHPDYIIAHKDGFIIKRITEHDVENGIITCHSLNPDKGAYPDFEISLADVDNLFNIVRVENPR